MSRQLEKSALDRIPSRLDKTVVELNKKGDGIANDYMTVSEDVDLRKQT